MLITSNFDVYVIAEIWLSTMLTLECVQNLANFLFLCPTTTMLRFLFYTSRFTSPRFAKEAVGFSSFTARSRSSLWIWWLGGEEPLRVKVPPFSRGKDPLFVETAIRQRSRNLVYRPQSRVLFQVTPVVFFKSKALSPRC